MKDKVVFITGANGGLGSSVTKAFLQQGARVIGGSLRITAADFPQPHFEAMAIDFSKLDEIKHGVAKIVERYGRLDALVHLLGGLPAARLWRKPPTRCGSRCRTSILLRRFTFSANVYRTCESRKQDG